MTTVLLEGTNLAPAIWPRQPEAERRAALRAVWKEIQTTGRPSLATLERLSPGWPRFAALWKPYAAATPSSLAGLEAPRRRRHPSRHAWAATLGEVVTSTSPNPALNQVLQSVPDPEAAAAYYARLDPIHAADNLPRERAWAAMMDQLLPLVRLYVKPDATRAQVEELALRIGLTSNAAGESIVPDRKMVEQPGANHASWMGGAIGYGGIGSWENLRQQAPTYLNQGFQWAEIFGRWSDPPNARTLANDSGAYPYLPTWAQPLAAQAWKNRRMNQVELASFSGHAAHVEQRAASWAAQMVPVSPSESAVGSPQVANAIIQAGTAANPVEVSVLDPSYMAPWETVKGQTLTQTGGPLVVQAQDPEGMANPMPVPIFNKNAGGNVQKLDAGDLPLMSVNLMESGVPYLQPIVDHAPPPVVEAPVDAPPQVVPQKVDAKTGLPPTAANTATATPAGVQTMLPPVQANAAQAQAQAIAQAQAAQLMAQQNAAMLAAQQGGGVSWFDQQMIPGVKNLYLLIGAGGLLLLFLSRRRG